MPRRNLNIRSGAIKWQEVDDENLSQGNAREWYAMVGVLSAPIARASLIHEVAELLKAMWDAAALHDDAVECADDACRGVVKFEAVDDEDAATVVLGTRVRTFGSIVANMQDATCSDSDFLGTWIPEGLFGMTGPVRVRVAIEYC